MGIINWYKELKKYYNVDIFCMNCYNIFNAKIKINTKIIGTEIVCPICKIKDKVRINKNGFGSKSHYIN